MGLLSRCGATGQMLFGLMDSRQVYLKGFIFLTSPSFQNTPPSFS